MCTVRACCVCVLSGPGLTFIVYPEALAMLPGSAIWSAVFFLTLFVMGLDTQVSLLLYKTRLLVCWLLHNNPVVFPLA